MRPVTEYRAVDLDIRSRASLLFLLKVWPWAQTPERVSGRAPRWLLLCSRSDPKSADQAILEWVQLIDALPPAGKRCWKRASSRVFDIGIDAGASPASFEGVTLREGTIKAIARVGGQLRVTVYAATDE